MLSVIKSNSKIVKNGGVKIVCELSNGIIQKSTYKEQGENIILLMFNQKYTFKKYFFESEEGECLFSFLFEKEMQELE
jgi:hypothetical protein